MKTVWLSYSFISILCIVALFNTDCNNKSNSEKEKKKPSSPFLNHGDSATYVGIKTCKTCHTEIYETFIETGMGKSFDNASKLKTSALFGSRVVVYDKHSDFYYHQQTVKRLFLFVFLLIIYLF